MHYKHQRCLRDCCHRHNRPRRIEWQLFANGGGGGIRRCVSEQRVAIRLRLGSKFSADHAASAGSVVDDYIPAPRVGQPLRDRPHNDIRAAARRIRNYQLHGSGRIWRLSSGVRRSAQGDNREN